MEDFMNSKNIADILTTQYDITLNGYEIGGGSIRAHEAETLRKVLNIIGHKDEDIDRNFGHMLNAFQELDMAIKNYRLNIGMGTHRILHRSSKALKFKDNSFG
jgi:hypothetical protein